MTTTRTRRRAALAASMALLLTTAACGGEDAGQDTAAPSPSSPAPEQSGETSSAPEGDAPSGDDTGGTSDGQSPAPSQGASEPPAPSEPLEPSDPEKPANTTFLKQVDVIKGAIRPKSVVSNDRGRVIANNMMYQHTMTVYDATSHDLVHTISDEVDLDALGPGGGTVKGAPVEAAFTRDGRTAYVTNYQMYGEGFTAHGGDECEKGEVTDHGYVYEVDVESGTVTGAIEAGAVPKYAALSPDEKTMLVSNWCDFDLSVIDVESGKETGRVPLGRWARGIDFAPDGTAFALSLIHI